MGNHTSEPFKQRLARAVGLQTCSGKCPKFFHLQEDKVASLADLEKFYRRPIDTEHLLAILAISSRGRGLRNCSTLSTSPPMEVSCARPIERVVATILKR